MGNKIRPRITQEEFSVIEKLRKGEVFSQEASKEFKEFQDFAKNKGQFELHKIVKTEGGNDRQTVALLQLSDQHIGETVTPESVLGLNEYNLDIAKERQKKVYEKAVKLIGHHQANYNINEVIVSYLGDSIGGWIHPELEQTNSISPNEEIMLFKSLTISGLKYLNDNLNVEKITIICISGNHARETKKNQHNNFSETNKEYWMYLDIKNICEMIGLTKLNFIIPRAEMAVIEMFNKRYLFTHGHQFNFLGGIGGIFPSMLRWFGQMAKVLKVEAAFIGHWHTSIFHPKVIVNGSAKGYDSFAISKGFEFEVPSQNLVLIDSEFGMCNYQKINL